MIISKELLSEVLGERVYKVEIVDTGVRIFPFEDIEGHEEINIHELAYKCKIKAIERGYVIIEYPNFVTIHKDGKKEITEKFNDVLSEHFRDERVFRATQWIYDKEK